MTNISSLLLSTAAAALMLNVTPAAAQSGQCIGNAQIQQLVSSGQILPLNEILSRAGIGRSAKVLPPVKVCDRGGQYYYSLNVLDQYGGTEKLNLQAATGQP